MIHTQTCMWREPIPSGTGQVGNRPGCERLPGVVWSAAVDVRGALGSKKQGSSGNPQQRRSQGGDHAWNF